MVFKYWTTYLQLRRSIDGTNCFFTDKWGLSIYRLYRRSGLKNGPFIQSPEDHSAIFEAHARPVSQMGELSREGAQQCDALHQFLRQPHLYVLWIQWVVTNLNEQSISIETLYGSHCIVDCRPSISSWPFTTKLSNVARQISFSKERDSPFFVNIFNRS